MSKPHITQKMITPEYAEALWSIVSGAVECGGIGQGAWHYQCKKGTDWKSYNAARDDGYTSTYPNVTLRLYCDEYEDPCSKYKLVNAQTLHDCLVKFVADESVPDYLREMYAGMLAIGKHPDGADAISDDCVFQYFFTDEILFS
jgi:hypothetical protein